MKLFYILVALILAVLAFVCFAGADTIIVAKKKAASGYDWSAVKVAEYRLETGALSTDSSGDGNTLSTTGVTANGTYYKQGSYSGDFDGSLSYGARTDANLSAGFAGKSSTGYQNFLIMSWARMDVLPDSGARSVVAAKYYATEGLRSYQLSFQNNAGTIYAYVHLSKDGTTTDLVSKELSSGDGWPSLAIDTWYHIALWHDSTLDKWGARLYVDGGSTYNYSVAYTNGVYLGTAAFAIGASINADISNGTGMLNGKLDQAVVYSWANGSNPTEQEILDQIDAVRGGTTP